MNLHDKVGNVVLKRGDVVKAPSGSSDWVVIDNDGSKIIVGCISKYMTKDDKDIREWYRVK
jgi:hypothetical protein